MLAASSHLIVADDGVWRKKEGGRMMFCHCVEQDSWPKLQGAGRRKGEGRRVNVRREERRRVNVRRGEGRRRNERRGEEEE